MPDGNLPISSVFKSNALLSLVVDDYSAITQLTVSINNATAFDITSRLSTSKSLRIPLLDLYALNSRTLSEGNHTLRFIARDSFGNVTQATALTFTIDNVAPSVPTRPVIVTSTGVAGASARMSDPTIRFRSTATPTSIVRIFVDGRESALAIAGSNSRAEFDLNLGALGDGTFLVTTTAEDNAGNRSGFSPALQFLVDTTPPAITQIGLAPASDTGALGDLTTTNAIVTLIGKTEANAVVRLVGGTQTVTADAGGNFTITQVPLSFGTNEVSVSATDDLGNSLENTLRIFRPKLESNPPLVAITLAEDTGQYFNDGITSIPDVSGAVQDQSAIAGLFISINGQDPVNVTAALQGNTFRLTRALIESALGEALVDGEIVATIFARDIYDNRSESQTITLQFDSTPPATPTKFELSPSTDFGSSNSDGVTNTSNLNFTLQTVIDGRLNIFVDGNPRPSLQLAAGTNDFTLTGFAEGDHQVTFSMTDVAGNTSPLSTPLNVRIDLTPPTPLNATVVPPASGTDVSSITGNTEPGATVFLYRGLDSQSAINSVVAAADGKFTFTAVSLRNGINRFRISAMDLAGNAVSSDISFRFDAPDLSPPEIQLRLANDTGRSATDLLTKDPSVTGRVNDASRIASFRISVGAGPFVNSLGSLVDGSFTLSRSILETIAGRALVDGSVRVRVSASDELGHISDTRELVFTLDTTRPDTPLPLNLSASTDSGTRGDGITNSATLQFITSVSAADAEIVLFEDSEEVQRRSSGTNVSIEIPSQKGRHTYVAQSVDAAGNVSFFTAPRYITFDDSFITPTVAISTTQQRIDLGGANYTSTQNISLVGKAEPGAKLELVGKPNFAIADSFGKYEIQDVKLNVGSNSFQVTASDAAGNSATVPFQVIFRDLDAPVIEVALANDTGVSKIDRRTKDPTIAGLVSDASTIVSLFGSIDGGAEVNITSSLIEDALSLPLASLELINGATLADGRHLLTLRATDSAGNVSTSDYQFDLDRTGPPVDAPPDLMTSSDLGHSAFDNLTAATEPVLRMYAERAALVTFFINGNNAGQVVSTGVAQFTVPKLAEGTYTVTATIEDAAGNRAGPSAPLSLTIDATAPALTSLDMAAVHQSKVQPTHTVDARVTLNGIAEPGSRITLTNSTLTPIASATGTFSFSVDLQLGVNTFVATAEDPAGNITQKTFTFTRGEKLVPRFDLTVTSNGDATPPTIAGVVRSENPLTSVQISPDPQFVKSVVSLTPFMVGSNFTLDPTALEIIRTAAYKAGQYTLYFRATDDQSRVSNPTQVSFTIDHSKQPAIQSQAVGLGGGLHQYTLTANGPTDLSQRVDSISIPIDRLVTASAIISPTGWTATYAVGGNAIVWTASKPSDALTTGKSFVFGYTANSAPTSGFASTVIADLANSGVTRTATIASQVPSVAGLFASPDFYALSAATTLTVNAATGVLANDAAGTTVNTFATRTRWGAPITAVAGGGFTIVPGTIYRGVEHQGTIVDSFTYVARSASGGLSTVTVFINVTGVNNAPVAVNDVPSDAKPSLYTRANVVGSIDAKDLLENDTDPDVNDVLSIRSVDAVSQLGATIALANGKVVYDARNVVALNQLAAGDFRLDSFTYTITDPRGGAPSTATAQIRVQSPRNVIPVAANATVGITEDGTITQSGFVSLLTGATDSDRIPLDPALAVVTLTTISRLGANVTLNADGSFRYDASTVSAVQRLKPGETLTDDFKFSVRDAFDNSLPATVTLNISGLNDAPVAGADRFGPMLANGLLTRTAANGLLSNDFDFDSTIILDPSRTPERTAAGAKVTLRPDGSFDYEPGTAFVSLPEGATATDTFTYVIVDNLGIESTATVTIDIVGVNDAPVAGADGIEKGLWAVASQKLEVPASKGVLSNDSDPDVGGSTLEAFFDGFSRYGARVIVRADGSFTYDPTVSDALRQFAAAGVDVIDSFTYTVREVALNNGLPSGGGEGRGEGEGPGQASSQGVVEIVVRSGPSGYSFDLVASGYDDIGTGVSINNKGNIAFQANESGKDLLYIWSEKTGPKSLIPEGFVFGSGQVSQPPDGGPGAVPSARFSEVVQINDNDSVFAQRQMNARGLMGVLPMGLPLLTVVDLALTYSELWNGGNVLKGAKYGTPRQIANGDMGLAAAGLRWGNPLFLDMQFAALTSLLPGFFGAALSLGITMVPRVWTLNPAWSSVYYTPVNPVWNVFQDPDNFDFDVLNAVSLATSLMPIYVPQIYVTPFVAIYPTAATVNNVGQTAFVAQTNNSEIAAGLNIVTGGHEGRKPYVNSPIDSVVTNIKLSDAGYSVFVQDGNVKAMDFFGEVQDLGMQSISSQAAISDNGLIAAAADGPHGRGIYVIDPTTGRSLKVVGESGDGILDANEILIDGQDVGGVASIIDGVIGINGQATKDLPGTPYYTVTFMATDSAGKPGLHSAKFNLSKFDDSVLNKALFIGHNRVLNLGEILPGIGAVNEIKSFDPINTSGQIVFWASGSGGDKVVRATPPLNATGDVIYAFERRDLSENEIFKRDGGAAIASFVAGDPEATPDQFVATINYGDGKVGRGTIKPKMGPDNKPLPSTYEVIAEHQYDREGPYAITVQISDTKNETGGIAVTLANIVNVVNEEDIERLVMVDDEGKAIKPKIESYASPLLRDPNTEDSSNGNSSSSGPTRSLGLATFAATNLANGTYEVVAFGTAGFQYSFGLETAGSDGQGEPNATETGDGSSINIRKVLARGSISATFSPGGFDVDSYETGFDGLTKVSGTQSSSTFSEKSSTSVQSTPISSTKRSLTRDQWIGNEPPPRRPSTRSPESVFWIRTLSVNWIV